MYKTLRGTFYWPSMALHAYHNVRKCSSCARESITLRKHATYLLLFPAQAPLKYVAIDILGPLSKNTDGHCYLLCITERYSKMVRTIPLKNITATTVANAFCEHWVFYNGPQLVCFPITAVNLRPSSCRIFALYWVFGIYSRQFIIRRRVVRLRDSTERSSLVCDTFARSMAEIGIVSRTRLRSRTTTPCIQQRDSIRWTLFPRGHRKPLTWKMLRRSTMERLDRAKKRPSSFND